MKHRFTNGALSDGSLLHCERLQDRVHLHGRLAQFRRVVDHRHPAKLRPDIGLRELSPRLIARQQNRAARRRLEKLSLTLSGRLCHLIRHLVRMKIGIVDEDLDFSVGGLGTYDSMRVVWVHLHQAAADLPSLRHAYLESVFPRIAPGHEERIVGARRSSGGR